MAKTISASEQVLMYSCLTGTLLSIVMLTPLSHFHCVTNYGVCWGCKVSIVLHSVFFFWAVLSVRKEYCIFSDLCIYASQFLCWLINQKIDILHYTSTLLILESSSAPLFLADASCVLVSAGGRPSQAEACRAHTVQQRRFLFPLTYTAGCARRQAHCHQIDSPVAWASLIPGGGLRGCAPPTTTTAPLLTHKPVYCPPRHWGCSLAPLPLRKTIN